MTALTIVEDLEVFEERGRELQSGRPSLPVQEFDLDTAPERFHQGVVVTRSDRAHRGQQAGILDPTRERP